MLASGYTIISTHLGPVLLTTDNRVGAHLDRRVEWALDGKTCRRPEDLSVAFEVLCGDASAAQWARFSDGLPANIPGWQPVEGGRTRDGVALLIARSGINGGVHLGGELLLLFGRSSSFTAPE